MRQVVDGVDETPVCCTATHDGLSTLQVDGCLHPVYHRRWTTQHCHRTSDCLRSKHLLH